MSQNTCLAGTAFSAAYMSGAFFAIIAFVGPAFANGSAPLQPGLAPPVKEPVFLAQTQEENQPEPAADAGQLTPVDKPRKPLPPASKIDRKRCLSDLKKIADVKAVTTPFSEDVACLIKRPVRISAITGSDSIKMRSNPTLDCYFATVLTDFLTNDAQPLAKQHLNKTISGLISGSGFVCRRRNNQVFGKLSQHAFGNAIDINGFRFTDGTQYQVNLDSKLTPQEQAFSRALREAACRSFTTVLGPGYDKLHDTHFHFDLARANGRKNPRRVCK